MTAEWTQIIEAYKKAAELLWETAPGAPSLRNRENGRICLFKAYHGALRQEKKEHLWYARILFMMYEQCRDRFSEDVLFRSFLSEARDEFHLAEESTDHPDRSELVRTELACKRSAQYIAMHGSSPRAQVSGLPGGLDLGDCRIISLSQEHDTAELRLESSGTAVTLRFTDIYELTASLSPSAPWISGITCCRHPHSGSLIFDAGLCRIICKEIQINA